MGQTHVTGSQRCLNCKIVAHGRALGAHKLDRMLRERVPLGCPIRCERAFRSNSKKEKILNT